MDWFPELRLPMLSLPQLLQHLVAALVVIGVQGSLVAALAERLGDPGPRQDGRRTMNPFVHLDVIGLAHALFFRVPWMQLIDVDPRELRGGWRGALVLTAASGFGLALFSGLLLAMRPFAFGLLQGSAGSMVGILLGVTSDVAIVVAVAHMLPVPPFVGAAWAPWGAMIVSRRRQQRVRWIAVGVLWVLSLTGFTGRAVGYIASSWRSLLGF